MVISASTCTCTDFICITCVYVYADWPICSVWRTLVSSKNIRRKYLLWHRNSSIKKVCSVYILLGSNPESGKVKCTVLMEIILAGRKKSNTRNAGNYIYMYCRQLWFILHNYINVLNVHKSPPPNTCTLYITCTLYFVHMYLASSDFWQKSTMVMCKLIKALDIDRYMYVLPVYFTVFYYIYSGVYCPYPLSEVRLERHWIWSLQRTLPHSVPDVHCDPCRDPEAQAHSPCTTTSVVSCLLD